MSPSQKPPSATRRLPWLMTTLTLVVLGVTISLVTRQLRTQLRDQMIEGDAEMLHAVAVMLQQAELDSADGSAPGEPPDLFPLMLKTSRLKGVIAARLYDSDGKFVAAFPMYATDGRVSGRELTDLRRMKAIGHFHAQGRPAELFLPAAREAGGSARVAPLLEVLVPFHTGHQAPLQGVGQFFIDGEDVAGEFAALDESLFAQASLAFLGSALIIVVGLGWTFRRLQKTQELLADRSANLLRANQELTLAAKTSAVGSITALLLHDLKSPLFGLHTIVSEHARKHSGELMTDWQAALESTRRMQGLVNELVRVLRDEPGATEHEVNLQQFVSQVMGRAERDARERAVVLSVQLLAEGWLPYRTANVAGLILDNLVRNALQATPAGGRVELRVLPVEGDVFFEVRDEGRGLPHQIQKALFTPCPSSKPGGNGIGLAIAKQLANHIGAMLELEQSTPQGCSFSLSVSGRSICKKAVLAKDQSLN